MHVGVGVGATVGTAVGDAVGTVVGVGSGVVSVAVGVLVPGALGRTGVVAVGFGAADALTANVAALSAWP